MTRIVVHIDRLVLRGVDRPDAAAVSAALHAELQARLGGEPGVAALARHHGSAAVRASPARVPLAADASSLGRAVAASIARAGAKP